MLADEFRAAALALFERARRGEPLSWAPARLTAIHAIELYLTAALRDEGLDPAEIRRFQHDLAKRVDRLEKPGLKWRKGTRSHLEQLGVDREYLVTRYGPERAGQWSQPNRLRATLEEVAKKTAPSPAPTPQS